VEELLPSRSLDRTPLIDVVFSVDATTGVAPRLPGLTTEVAEVHTGTAKFDLDVAVVGGSDALACTVEFNTDVFTESSARRLVDGFRRTLRAALTDPHQRLPELGGEPAVATYTNPADNGGGD
jgi:hypothetical protein